MRIPTFQKLMTSVNSLKKAYKNNNPVRIELITFLEVFQQFAKNTLIENPNYSQDELRDICLGAWIFCLKSISCEKKYVFINPEFKKGKIFESGSTLYSEMLTQLEFNQENYLEPQNELIYLEKFYSFLFNNNASAIHCDVHSVCNELHQHKISSEELKSNLIYALKNTLMEMQTNIEKFIRTMPPEETIDKDMSQLYAKYMAAIGDLQAQKQKSYFSFFYSTPKENPDRVFKAQLAEAVCHILSARKNEENGHAMSRTRQKKNGVLLYILFSIENENKKGRLHAIVQSMLNIDKINDIDDKTQLLWIAAFKNFLRSDANLDLIVQYGKDHFGEKNLLNNIDPKVNEIFNELEHILTQLSQKTKNQWPVTQAAAEVSSLLAAPAGYGLGYAMGSSLCETAAALPCKVKLGNGINYVSIAFLGFTQSYIGLWTAGIILPLTLGRAFAKVLEQLFMLVGYAAGASIPLVFEGSYKGLQHLCRTYMHLHNQIKDPDKIKHIDLNLIKSILNLPPEVFAEEKKLRLQKVMPPLVTPDPTPEKNGENVIRRLTR